MSRLKVKQLVWWTNDIQLSTLTGLYFTQKEGLAWSILGETNPGPFAAAYKYQDSQISYSRRTIFL